MLDQQPYSLMKKVHQYFGIILLKIIE